ncbi:MAG: hypothetical protein VB075_19415 [Petrimonas sp.]|uniref:hypothetical protein n=1 Tax=Petrimonas sp. TaxID=2023866 RepID=UPI002B3DFB18|nr:hypothetical protein [Petrimonas sp.]MEA5046721.1 hypothetical protein [Petrimonas sp.]
MEVYIIEGPANSGKSSLIYSQYLKLLNTKNYTIVENEKPDILSDFKILLKNKDTKECTLFNSPTDDARCITNFEKFYRQWSEDRKGRKGYNITRIITSCRPNTNGTDDEALYEQTRDVIKKIAPSVPPEQYHVIDISLLGKFE